MAYRSSPNLWLRWHSRCLGGMRRFLPGPWHYSAAWVSFVFVALGINQDLVDTRPCFTAELCSQVPYFFCSRVSLYFCPLLLQDSGEGIANGVETEHLLKVAQHNLSVTQGRLSKPLGQDTC